MHFYSCAYPPKIHPNKPYAVSANRCFFLWSFHNKLNLQLSQIRQTLLTHGEVPLLLRRWARAYVARTPGLDPLAQGLVVARWAPRLSAALLRGNAAVLRRAGYSPPSREVSDQGDEAPLPHLVPEGPSSYELLVGS